MHRTTVCQKVHRGRGEERYHTLIYVSQHHILSVYNNTSLCLVSGLQTDGIYRVSGNLATIQKLRFAVDHGEKGLDVTAVAL